MSALDIAVLGWRDGINGCPRWLFLVGLAERMGLKGADAAMSEPVDLDEDDFADNLDFMDLDDAPESTEGRGDA